jgi:hypothetical protein
VALACLAAEADHAGERLARQGYALIDGSSVDLHQAVAAFDALRADSEESQRIAPDHPLVDLLLVQPAVRELVAEVIGPTARPVAAFAFDQTGHRNRVLAWQQSGGGAPVELLEGMLTLRWYLDLIGPADGGLRVLPGSHSKGRLTSVETDRLALETPAVELAVSAGTVLVLRPLLVQGARRRTTRGHRRILQVDLAAGDPPTPLEWAWA